MLCSTASVRPTSGLSLTPDADGLRLVVSTHVGAPLIRQDLASCGRGDAWEPRLTIPPRISRSTLRMCQVDHNCSSHHRGLFLQLALRGDATQAAKPSRMVKELHQRLAASLAAVLIVVALAPVPAATATTPSRACAKSKHPARDIEYNQDRMKATFTFDTKRCMEPDPFWLIQARVFREPNGNDAVGKLCKPDEPCKISVAVPHDLVEARAEYRFELYYADSDGRPIRNYIGPYFCTSLIFHHECSTDDQ